ncbi:MAG: adenylate/guanylate cyclase domain-containing protein [Rhodospirillales bacterium]|nr:adenylate/guanylate cyclase domain-containing protein [Rhodospirillales bacterium]
MAREQRRLAAIVSADIAGYSRLMGRDESGTLAALKALRAAIVDPAIATHGGRIVKTTGDGLLLDFPSVVDAVRCVIEVQTAMAADGARTPEDRRIAFRIGVNLGDIIIDGDDIVGDGVNIAARLQEIAAAGGVCVSSRVHDDIRDRLAAAFEDGGAQKLKNIARPVHVWRWSPASAIPATAPAALAADAPLAMPDKPSIAVLPFANMSGDPQQEYFADGITEDILTELSRFHELFVIARNSTFSYKGKSPDIRTVGRDLGVRYVLEGSIRKAANRVRVTGQLIDTLNGAHIWAERYDRVLEDIFAVQEELTGSIVRAIAPQILEAETAKVRRRRPENLSAYESAVRANAKAWESWIKSDRALRDEAIADARAALAIDPRSTIALAALSFAQWQHLAFATAADRAAAWKEAMEMATRAIEADRAYAFGHSMNALLLVFAGDRDRIDDALASARTSYDLNPHAMASLTALSFVETVSGDPDSAVEHLLAALRLSPRDPQRPTVFLNLAMASGCAGRYADGVTYATLGIREAPGFAPLYAHLAVNYVGLGEIDKARAAVAESSRIAPGQVERSLAGFMYRKPEHQRRGTTFLRIAAGLDDPAAADALR